jgi:glycosyltransferase involved in cell wall biosynthesis
VRIAFFCPHSDPLAATGEPDAGGQCVYEAKVAAGLAALGHEVRAYTRLWADKPARDEIAPGAAVFRYAMGPEGFLRKEDMGPHLPQFVAALLADQRDWLAEAHVFHGHYWDGGAAALMAGLSLGRPLVFTSHSLGRLKRERLPDPTPDGSQFRYLLRIAAETRILAAADRVVALSRSETDALVEGYATAAGKVRIIPGGVDLDAFGACPDKGELQRKLGFDTDFLLFTAGRLDPRKGFLELIRAIPGVLARLGPQGRSVTFCIPEGPENPSADEAAYRDALRAEARRLGVERAIRWFQRLEDDALKAHYRAADLFLCPSLYEPFGLVVVEAFACGTPVVATRRGGPAEIVTHGIDGFLADPADAEAFAGYIAEALLAPETQRRDMRRAALAKAHDRYGWPAVAAALAAVYAEL